MVVAVPVAVTAPAAAPAPVAVPDAATGDGDADLNIVMTDEGRRQRLATRSPSGLVAGPEDPAYSSEAPRVVRLKWEVVSGKYDEVPHFPKGLVDSVQPAVGPVSTPSRKGNGIQVRIAPHSLLTIVDIDPGHATG